jgi:hypothetical protein
MLSLAAQVAVPALERFMKRPLVHPSRFASRASAMTHLPESMPYLGKHDSTLPFRARYLSRTEPIADFVIFFVRIRLALTSVRRTMVNMESSLVRRDQFNISPQGIVHKPTDAAFTPSPGDPFSGIECLGQLRNQNPNGNCFRTEDVLRVMRELWAEYVAGNPRLFKK